MGTAVGTNVFLRFGWRPAAALSLGWTGFCLFIMLIRGPHCSRYTWFGYEGGLRLRKVPAQPQSAGVPSSSGPEKDVEKGKGEESVAENNEDEKVARVEESESYQGKRDDVLDEKASLKQES